MNDFDDYPVFGPTKVEIEDVLRGHIRVFGEEVPRSKHVLARYWAGLMALQIDDDGPATAEAVAKEEMSIADWPLAFGIRT